MADFASVLIHNVLVGGMGGEVWWLHHPLSLVRKIVLNEPLPHIPTKRCVVDFRLLTFMLATTMRMMGIASIGILPTAMVITVIPAIYALSLWSFGRVAWNRPGGVFFG